MGRKLSLIAILIVVLVSVLVKVQKVRASGSIHIRADGSVDPQAAPIRCFGDLYTLTDNVYDSIVVERSNIVIDGRGYSLQGSGDGNGISVHNISNVTVKNVSIRDFSSGVSFNSTTHSVLSRCYLSDNKFGVDLGWSSQNTITGNKIVNSEWWGIWLNGSHSNAISGNDMTDNYLGVYLGYSSSNTLLGNNMTNGYLGIYFFSSRSNILSNNRITNNNSSVWLEMASENTFFGNNMIGNLVGIWLYSSYDNTFYHNNFNNTIQLEYEDSITAWNGTSLIGGNHWSNYAGVDNDQDGIGDSAYVIDENNRDYYPLMGMFSSYETPYGCQVDFVSNSTNSNVDFSLIDGSRGVLSFDVTGEVGTQGFCRVCFPKTLLDQPYVIRFDNETIAYPQVRELPRSNETYECLYVTYVHSGHRIEISGTTTVPEYLSFIVLPLFIIVTSMPIVFCRRKCSA